MVTKTAYSLREIADILCASTDDVSRIVDSDERLKKERPTESKGYLETEQLDRFFKSYVEVNKIKPISFEIPDLLREMDTKWAETIIDMYEEPFSYGSVTPNQGEIIRNLVLEFKPKATFLIPFFPRRRNAGATCGILWNSPHDRQDQPNWTRRSVFTR